MISRKIIRENTLFVVLLCSLSFFVYGCGGVDTSNTDEGENDASESDSIDADTVTAPEIDESGTPNPTPEPPPAAGSTPPAGNPVTTPLPTPTPEPNPAPQPIPAPTPAPNPQPDPTPTPDPTPAPAALDIVFERYMADAASETDLKCFNDKLVVLNHASHYYPIYGGDPEPVLLFYNQDIDPDPSTWGYTSGLDENLLDSPIAMDIAPNGTIYIVDREGGVGEGKVGVLKPDNSPLSFWPGLQEPTEIAAADDLVYILDETATSTPDKLYAVDPVTVTVVNSISPDYWILDMMIRGNYLYLAAGSKGILKLDRYTLQVVGKIDETTIDKTSMPYNILSGVEGIDMDSEGRIFWVETFYVSSAYYIDSFEDKTPTPFLRQDTVNATLPWGNAISVCGNYVYLADGFEAAPDGVIAYRINR